MSIDLVIGRYHGKGAFKESIKINVKFTPGRDISKTFRISHVQCKKYNGEIVENTVMSPIG